MKIAFWPGLGGGIRSFDEVVPVLHARGIDATTLDPRYGTRSDWSLATLAAELSAAGGDVYSGHSWGDAIAATAAADAALQALVLLDGGHLGPHEFARLGGGQSTDERIAEIREEHATYRWPSSAVYLEWARAQSPRWNETIEADALEGMRFEDGEVLPPFDSDVLERIVRAYERYDPIETLPRVRTSTRVLLVAARSEGEHAEVREELIARLTELVPHADTIRVDTGHDVVWGLGPELGRRIADWLEAP